MKKSEDEQIQHYAKLQALGIVGDPEVHKWYGWASPVGLTIFILGLAFFAILIHFAFLMK